MAQRDLNFSPEVNNVVAEKPNQLPAIIGKIGITIADQSAKSKLLVNASKVQVAFKELDTKYRLQNADDPTNADALRNLAEERAAIADQYGESIPFLYNREWQLKTQQFSVQSDAENEMWAYNQQRVNTVNNFNESTQTYLNAAAKDGAAYGVSDDSELSAALGYLSARGQLEEYGTPVLGHQKTQEMLKTFNSDYIKLFVSGAIESNPAKGVKMLQEDFIKDSMPFDQYIKFKTAAEHRAAAVIKNQEQHNIIQPVRNSSDTLMNGGKMDYATIQQQDFTPAAKEYFESLNGFTGSGQRGGFSPEDKAAFQLGIFDAVLKLQQDKDMDASSVRVVQDAIYKGMNKGAITQAQGQEYISQIVAPLVARKEEAMSKFGQYNWIDDSLGFDGVQEFYEKNVQRSTDGLNKDTKRAVEAGNMVSKANLYDYYYGALSGRAQAAGVPVADIPRLPKAQRNKIYSGAQSDAQIMFMRDKHPALRTMPDIPNFVYSNGKLIQGATGPRDVKADKAAQPTFKLQKDTDTGEIWRVYPNGQKELASKGGK